MVETVFTAAQFEFPYLYKFPGQSSDERILYVTREHPVMLQLRQIFLVVAAMMVIVTGWFVGNMVKDLQVVIGNAIEVFSLGLGVGILALGWWWVGVLWRKSIALLTNKRLTKFIYTTPWNRHNLSLPLEMVVDTGSYSKGFFQAWFKLGTFTARSSASSSGVATDDPERVNKKYFYIENVANAEDLHHYLHKVLFVFRQDWSRLANFRPFLPHLKGEARKQFMLQYPEYWS
jgi:hypothetical protein